MTLGSINILKSTGVQDDYLIGNPQMTFFKSVYRKHTNFSSDWIDIESKDITDFGKKIKFKLPTLKEEYKYFRTKITSSTGSIAWSQPIFFN